MGGESKDNDEDFILDRRVADLSVPTDKTKSKASKNSRSEYDQGVDDLIKALQYLTDESSLSIKTPLVYGAFGLAKMWAKPTKLESPADYFLWPIKFVFEIIATIIGVVVGLLTAVSAAALHPEHTHHLRVHLDKIQDPKVLATLLSDEKFWDFAINHISAIRAIAVKSADSSLKGLLTDLLTKEVMNEFKNTFRNADEKAFLREVLKLAFDKDLQKFHKEELNKRIGKVIAADGFQGFLVKMTSNRRLYEVLCKHPPLGEILNAQRVAAELVVDLVTGPVKELLEKPIVQEVLREPTIIESLLAGKVPENITFTQDTLPEFITTVLTNDKLWDVVVNHADDIRITALRNSPQELHGLLTDLIDRSVLTSLKETFQGETHRGFLKKAFALVFEKDKAIAPREELLKQVQMVLGLEQSIAETSPEELQKKVSEVIGTAKYKEFVKDLSLKQLFALSYDPTLNWNIMSFFRAEMITRMKGFLGSEEFMNFLRDFAIRDIPLLKVLSSHSPIKDALEQFGISQELLIKLVSGPIKRRPEDLQMIFESLNNGRFVQVILGLVRDHPGVYGQFIKENAQHLRWPIDKFLNDNDYWIDENGKQQVFLKPIRDALREFFPNLDFAKIVGAAADMSREDITAIIKSFDAIMQPEPEAKDRTAASNLYSKFYIVKQLGKLAGMDIIMDSFLTSEAKEVASGKTSLASAIGIVVYDEGDKHNFLAEYLRGSNRTGLDGQSVNFGEQPGIIKGLVEFNKRNSKAYQGAVLQAFASSTERDLAKRFKEYYEGLPANIKSKLEYYKLNFRSLDYLQLDKFSLKGTIIKHFTVFGSSFTSCDFSKTKLIGSRIYNTSFLNSKFLGSNLHNCEFSNLDFTGCSFKGATINKCQFNGLIKIAPDALKGATIDPESLNSLIKACERSGIVLDLTSVNLTGDPHNKINWLSPAIQNYDKMVEGHKLKLREGVTLPRLRTLQIISSLGDLLPSDKVIQTVERLFEANEDDIMATYLANNFKYKSYSEIENYETPAGKINYVVSKSIENGNIDEDALRTNILATVLAESVCSEIFPKGSIFGITFTSSKEEQVLADFVKRTLDSLKIDPKQFQKMFELDEKGGLRLKPKHNKLIADLSKLIKAYSVDMFGNPISVTKDTIGDPELQVLMRAMIESYSNNEKTDLHGLTFSNDLYLIAKDRFKKAGIELSKEFCDHQELLLVLANIGLDSTLENIEVIKSLMTGDGWMAQYLKDKIRFEEPVQSREQMAETYKHFDNVKDSSRLILSDMRACVKDGVLDVNKFKLRMMANKIADQVSKGLFGDGSNRAADCLLLQEMILANLKSVSIKGHKGQVELEHRVNALEKMFENAYTIKPAFKGFVDDLVLEIRSNFCKPTLRSVGGIKLDRQKLKPDSLGNKIRKLLSFAALDERVKQEGGSVEELSIVAREISENIARQFWGDGIEGNRQDDFRRLTNFVDCLFKDAALGVNAHKTDYKDAMGKRHIYAKAIEDKLRAKALCRTAIGLVSGGTQLKAEFRQQTKFRKHLKDEIMASIYAGAGGRDI